MLIKKYSLQQWLVLATLIMSISFRDIPVISVYVKLIPPAILFLQYGINKWRKLEKYKASFYFVYLLFFLFGLSSVLWAARKDYVISESFVLFRLFFTVFILGFVIHDIDDVEESLKLFTISGIVMVIRLLINTPTSTWVNAVFGTFDASSGAGRIGATIGYHPNGLAAVVFFLLLLAAYYYSEKKTLIRLGWIVVLGVILVFTKSRLSMGLAIAGLATFYITSQKRKSEQIAAILIIAVLSIAGFWAVFNVPVLYNFVGFRLAGLFGTKGEQDASTLTRFRFFIYALSLFKSKPVFGVGLDNFKYYSFNYAHAWAETYAHSNWGELLADTGIIGTFLYYFIQIVTSIRLFRLIKQLDSNYRKLCALLFSFMIVTILGDVQTISYDTFCVMFPCMLAYFSSVYLKKCR